MISPSAPRLAVTRVIGEIRRSAIGLTTAGVVRLVRPVRLAPWFRFGHAIQEGKACLQHGASRISSHVGDIAQAQVTDLNPGAMLGLSIRGVLLCGNALWHQTREHASSTKDHEQNQRNDKAERPAYDPGHDNVADDQDNCSCDDAGAQDVCTLVLIDAEGWPSRTSTAFLWA
jgi:hypothetical protein